MAKDIDATCPYCNRFFLAPGPGNHRCPGCMRAMIVQNSPGVICSKCQARLSLPPNSVGRFRCPKCKTAVSLPSAPKEAGSTHHAATPLSMEESNSSTTVHPGELQTSERPAHRPWLILAAFGSILLLTVSLIIVAFQLSASQKEAEQYKAEANRVRASLGLPPFQPEQSPISKNIIVRVTAETLVAKYETDPLQADKDYRDKVLEVEITGKLEHGVNGRYRFVSAQPTRLVERPFVPQSVRVGDVRGLMQNALANAEYLPAVYMYVKKSEIQSFPTAQWGTRVVVRGVCRGASRDKNTRPETYVTLDDCVLVSGQ
jgi:tRNA_anti-like